MFVFTWGLPYLLWKLVVAVGFPYWSFCPTLSRPNSRLLCGDNHIGFDSVTPKFLILEGFHTYFKTFLLLESLHILTLNACCCCGVSILKLLSHTVSPQQSASVWWQLSRSWFCNPHIIITTCKTYHTITHHLSEVTAAFPSPSVSTEWLLPLCHRCMHSNVSSFDRDTDFCFTSWLASLPLYARHRGDILALVDHLLIIITSLRDWIPVIH